MSNWVRYKQHTYMHIPTHAHTYNTHDTYMYIHTHIHTHTSTCIKHTLEKLYIFAKTRYFSRERFVLVLFEGSKSYGFRSYGSYK